MQNTCPNPGCGAVYNLTAQHVGRQFACRKCGTVLAVDMYGLRVADAGGAAPAEAHASAGAAAGAGAGATMPAHEVGADLAAAAASTGARVPRPRGATTGGGPADILASLRTDLFTWLFGAGTVLVVLFTFFPLLDVTGLASMQAYITARQQELDRADREGTQADAAERKARREEWEKQRKTLSQDLADKQTSNQRMLYWYTWGTLVGFLLLGTSALGFVATGTTTARRVTGVVVLCSLVVMIFLFSLVGSSVLSIGSTMGRMMR